jgi:NADPH-dependent 7-cyano-7-deazaguanine reductase QueF
MTIVEYYLVGFRDNPKEVITQISFDGNTDSEKRESFSSDSSENSTNDVIDSSFVTTAPFSPKPFNTLQTSRVIGLDKELSLGLLKRPKSEENKKGRYHEQIFGSMLQPVPPSGISIFETHSKHSNDSDLNYSVNITELDLDKNGTVKHADFCQSVNITEIDSNCDFCQTVDITQLDFDNNKSKGEAGNQRDVLNYSVNITELDLDKNGTVKHRDFCQTVDITQLDFDNIKLKGETCDQAQIKHSDDSDLIHSVNITELDLDKNGTVKHRDFCQSVNITEIDSNCDFRKTVDITQLDFDNIKGEAGNQRDVLIGDEVVDTTMKARQEQNQLKQYAQLLQAAINDGDQENARQYADILAASHLKIAITVDENSLKVEANSQDIK